MDAGFIHVVEVGQYFMTKDTGDFRQFLCSGLVANTLFHEMTIHLSQPEGMDSRKYENWACIGSHDQLLCTVNMELKSESGL